MLSATADHAVRALLYLARATDRTSGDRGRRRPLRADEIAAATGAPQNYLAKTLNALAKAGILTSSRGPAGGFALAVAPDALTLDRVVDLFEAPRPQSRCMLGAAPCDPRHPCAAHECWTAVMNARRAPLAATTVADLLAGPRDDVGASAASAAAAAAAAAVAAATAAAPASATLSPAAANDAAA